MAEKKKSEPKTLNPDVAAKYNCAPNFLYGQKLVFAFASVHGVKNKPAHELTVEEVDKLVAAKAVKGVFSLKPTVAAPAVNESTNNSEESND